MPETARFELPHSLDTYEQLGDWALQLAQSAADIESTQALDEALSDAGLDLALRVVRGYGNGDQNQDRSREFYAITEYDQKGHMIFSARITTEPPNISPDELPYKYFTIYRASGSKDEPRTETFTIPIAASGEPLRQEFLISVMEEGVISEVTDPSTGASIIASLFSILSKKVQQRTLPRAA